MWQLATTKTKGIVCGVALLVIVIIAVVAGTVGSGSDGSVLVDANSTDGGLSASSSNGNTNENADGSTL